MSIINKLKEISGDNNFVKALNEFEDFPEKITVQEIWDKIIKVNISLYDNNKILEWHKKLMEYVKEDKGVPVFPVRYRSGDEFRGFITEVNSGKKNGYAFFFVDNEHTKYYQEMYLAGYVPSVEEILNAYHNREFPIGGMKHYSVAEKAAYKNIIPNCYNGKNYYFAHIFSAGENIGKYKTISKMITSLFPPANGKKYSEEEWRKKKDGNGKIYYSREVVTENEEAREYIVSAFLRYVHPFNYFLIPQSFGVGENKNLIEYVKAKYAEIYKDYYQEFLDFIKPETTQIESIEKNADVLLAIKNSKSPKANRKQKDAIVSSNTNRDNTKYSFDGVGRLTKGRLVFTVVKDYIKNNTDIKYEELNRVFTDDLNRAYGVVKRYDDVVALNKQRGYFCNENDWIELKNGDRLVVCRQWEATDRYGRGIDGFLLKAKSIGYETRIKAIDNQLK